MFSVSFAPPAGSVKLIGVPGHRKGTKVRDLKPGDVIMWNGGATSTVLAVNVKNKMVDVTTRSDSGEYVRRMGADRLVVLDGAEIVQW